MALAISVSSVTMGAPLLHLQRTLVPGFRKTKMDFNYSNPVQIGRSVQAQAQARKLVIRAARTHSQGVSLGFRAPSFQVLHFTCFFAYLPFCPVWL